MTRHLRFLILPVFAALLSASPGRAADLAPYTLSPGVDLPLIGAGALMKIHSNRTLARTRNTPLDLNSVRRDDLHPMDRWAAGNYSPTLSSLSGGINWAIGAVPLLANGWDLYKGNQTWFGAAADLILLQEALVISSSLVSYSKATLKLHPTPMVYEGSTATEAEKLDSRNVSSFFSGHTTAAFTTAVFTAYTYQLKHQGSPLVPWVWGGSLAAASTVGGLRIAAGKHFPSDILAGAAVGSAVGYLVPRLHLRGGFFRSRERATLASRGRLGREPRAEKPSRVDVDLGLAAVGGSTMPVPTLTLKF